MKYKHFIYTGLITVLAFSPFSSLLAQFNSGHIISDAQLYAPNTMNTESIQAFLEQHDGVLKNHVDTDIDGHLKTAAMIINDAAKRHGVNPQILLVKLQKEMGLITDSTPKQSQFDWAMGYGVCDDCDVNHPSVIKYKGFAKQIDNAAEFMAYVPKNEERFFYRSGQEYIISGEDVYIENGVTAALYNYTPHIHGNEIFSALWDKWFGVTYIHPEGSLLQGAGEAGIWLIKGGKKHAFSNFRAFSTRFTMDQVIQVDPIALNNYPTGAAITFAKHEVVQTPDGRIYLIEENQKRLVSNEFTFKQLGYTVDELTPVTEEEIAYFLEGQPITESTLNPFGALIQDPETNGVYYVQNGIKQPLIAPELLSLNYSGMVVRKATEGELDRYVKGLPIRLKDGLLVKTADSPIVYVIADGYKLPIDSEATFLALGYKWNQIEIITAGLMELHPIGQPLQLQVANDTLGDLTLHTNN